MTELGLSHLFRHGLMNPYLITRENKGRQGIDVTQIEHGVRRQLWILVRSWTNECARNRSVDRQVTIRVRPYVTSTYIFDFNQYFELEQIPYIPKERFGGQHSLLSAPGGARRACVACGTKTVFFCYGCSLECPGVAHICNPARDKGRGCWNRVHRIRDPRYQGSESTYKKRKRDSISYTGSNDRKRKWREARESPDEPIRKKPMQRKSSKKGVKLNPHHL